MLSAPNGRNSGSRRSLPRGAGVREFAALEFPREDYHWVVSTARSDKPLEGGFWARWGRFWRSVGTPRKAEPDRSSASEPSATA